MLLAQERGEDQSDWERVQAAGDFEWNGQDDEDRPLSKEEMRMAISRLGSREAHQKVSATLPLDTEILVQESRSIQTIEKSDFFKKSDFLDF